MLGTWNLTNSGFTAEFAPQGTGFVAATGYAVHVEPGLTCTAGMPLAEKGALDFHDLLA